MVVERTRDEHRTEVEETKAVLRYLAGADAEAVVDRAAAAVDDLDAAVAFVEDVGVDELERAVESADDPDVRVRGKRALSAFRQFRAAAAGEPVAGDPDVGEPLPDHFRAGHDIDLRGGDETPTE